MNKAYKKTYNKWFLTKVKRAIKDHGLISPGDRIAVGMSGGKDSSTLLFILDLLRRYSSLDFEVVPITLDLGWEMDITPLKEYCSRLGYSLQVVPTQIAKIVFEVRQEKNPCSLCAVLRRGALHNAALKHGCNKVALGHHLDDAIETFLLNLIYTGKLGTFPPKLYLDRTGLTLIRPMAYLPQKTVESIARTEKLPIIPNPCPANGHTKRQEMKELVNMLAKTYPDIRNKFLSALGNVEVEHFWIKKADKKDKEGDNTGV